MDRETNNIMILSFCLGLQSAVSPAASNATNSMTPMSITVSSNISLADTSMTSNYACHPYDWCCATLLAPMMAAHLI